VSKARTGGMAEQYGSRGTQRYYVREAVVCKEANARSGWPGDQGSLPAYVAQQQCGCAGLWRRCRPAEQCSSIISGQLGSSVLLPRSGESVERYSSMASTVRRISSALGGVMNRQCGGSFYLYSGEVIHSGCAAEPQCDSAAAWYNAATYHGFRQQ
jgi:hypothetical protein